MNINQMKIVLVLLSILITSCASIGGAGPHISRYPEPQADITIIPELQILTNTELGEPMLVMGKTFKYDAIKLLTPIEHVYANNRFRINIPAGTFKAIGKTVKPKKVSGTSIDVGGVFYQGEGISLRNLGNGHDYDKEGGVLISENNGISHAVWYDGTSRFVFDPINKINYKKEVVTEWGDKGLRQELVYNGISNGQVKFIYREFIDGMIRDKFTQEASYDITKDKIIGFKGARFEIISADNTKIKYKVLKYFK